MKSSTQFFVSVASEPLNSTAALTSLQNSKKSQDTGALVTFSGSLRANEDGKQLEKIFLEYYPAMADKQLLAILQSGAQRWPLLSAQIYHRVGDIYPGEEIVFLLVEASHRREAFEAAEFIMDYLKSQAPFWKQAIFKDGSSEWIAPKDSDQQRLALWD